MPCKGLQEALKRRRFIHPSEVSPHAGFVVRAHFRHGKGAKTQTTTHINEVGVRVRLAPLLRLGPVHDGAHAWRPRGYCRIHRLLLGQAPRAELLVVEVEDLQSNATITLFTSIQPLPFTRTMQVQH